MDESIIYPEKPISAKRKLFFFFLRKKKLSSKQGRCSQQEDYHSIWVQHKEYKHPKTADENNIMESTYQTAKEVTKMD